jgi:zinc D-Ala-D-Ala carboxypeptidase
MHEPTHFAHFSEADLDRWRWPHFSPEELACRGTGALLVDPRSLDMLEELRRRIGKPMLLNSAYRSPEHNRRVGGARNSYHMRGMAFDCRMDNHDPHRFIAAARAVGFQGIGQYADKGFVHIDTRAEPAAFGSRDFPVRKSSRFAPEETPRPYRRAAAQGGVAALVIAQAHATLPDVAPILPDRWLPWVTAALAIASAVVVAVPVVRRLFSQNGAE